MKKNIGKNIKINTYSTVAISALISLLIMGTVIYHYLENWTWIEALYFTVATLATVGYGDLHPTSDTSRLFTVFFILIGVSIGIAAITYIGGRYLSKREEDVIRRQEARVKEKKRKNRENIKSE